MNSRNAYKHHGPQWGWNDPDMLEIANGGMSLAEYQTHFQWWSIVKAPLILGNDISDMNLEFVQLVLNKYLIRINQDPLGLPARCVFNCQNQ